MNEILLSIGTFIIGTVVGSVIGRTFLKDLARWLRELIPGKELEKVIGDALILIGTELKNGTITAAQARIRLQNLFRYNL
jgi:uncharacterized membrane protein required for colicin V production